MKVRKMTVMRVSLLVLFGVFFSFSSTDIFANKNENLFYRLANCTQILNDQNRLICFDKLAKKNTALLTSVKVNNKPVLQIEPVTLKNSKQIDNFSKQHLKKTKEERGPNSILATISNVKQLIRGQWVISFENGQKWQQTDSAKIKLKEGNNIRLEKGSLGAVYLFKENSHRNIRVKRLK